MSGKFLLDTNITIALFGKDSSVLDRLQEAESVFVPSIVLGELFFGAYKSTHVEENVERVNEFAIANAVISCDTATARHYGQIKSGLRTKGRPIPENDIWIAAIARQYDLTLVSRDVHFGEVEDLKVEAW